MKCSHCGTELFVGNRFCPECGVRLENQYEDGVCMTKKEFFRLALPQKHQSFFDAGIYLTFVCAIVNMIASLWSPMSGMIQAFICLFLAIGLQISKSIYWAIADLALSAVCLVLGIVIDGSFFSAIALIAGVFTCIGASALSTYYTVYLISGKTPELGDEEGRHMVQKFKIRKNIRVAAITVLCLSLGITFAASSAVHISGDKLDAGYTVGTVDENGRYENEFAGIDFCPDDSWSVLSLTGIDAKLLQIEVGHVDTAVYYAVSDEANSTLRLDLVKQPSVLCSAENVLDSYVSRGVASAQAVDIDYTHTDFATFKLGNIDYLAVSGCYSQTGNSNDIYEFVLCRQVGSYSVIFTVYSTDHEILNTITNWF